MIKLNNVNKKYDNEIVLNDINIHVLKSDIFALVGHSGAGKSTILKIMSGFLKPDSGEVLVFGKEINSDLKTVNNTSMIFQNYNLLNNLTVRDNILLPLKIRKKLTKDDYNKVNELLEFVGLTDKRDNYINILSGGEKQRVAIARALITDPSIIFLDEPTSALDTKNTNLILGLLKTINLKYKTTLVLVSHDIDVVKSIANKAVIIKDGKTSEVINIKTKNIKEYNYEELLYD